MRIQEERFKITLDRGYKLLEDLMQRSNVIDGENAFKLYDTFGFPLELTIEIAAEKGVRVDKDGFNEEMKALASLVYEDGGFAAEWSEVAPVLH